MKRAAFTTMATFSYSITIKLYTTADKGRVRNKTVGMRRTATTTAAGVQNLSTRV